MHMQNLFYQYEVNTQKYSYFWRRSQWPRGLNRAPTAAHLLRLRDRIPTGTCTFPLVSSVRCQVEISASGWSLDQRSPIECSVSMWSWSLDNVALAQKGLLFLTPN